MKLRLKYSEPIVRKLFKLLHMMKGDTDYVAMLPCNYVAQEHEDELKVKECA